MLNPETLLGNKPLPDIFECVACGYRFPRAARCPECDGGALVLFMRAPSRQQVRFYSEPDRQAALTEIDPDWRDRFTQDAAELFYGLEARRPQ
jgi:hypothetical protein